MSKCNAKEELLNAIEQSKQTIICAIIKDHDPENNYHDRELLITLKHGYSEEDYATFLNAIDFEYDDGFGGQELYGTVWLTNGEWLERGEYDGSEWWDHNKLPEIPDNLKGY